MRLGDFVVCIRPSRNPGDLAPHNSGPMFGVQTRPHSAIKPKIAAGSQERGKKGTTDVPPIQRARANEGRSSRDRSSTMVAGLLLVSVHLIVLQYIGGFFV